VAYYDDAVEGYPDGTRLRPVSEIDKVEYLAMWRHYMERMHRMFPHHPREVSPLPDPSRAF
jgi:hypothetical protein